VTIMVYSATQFHGVDSLPDWAQHARTLPFRKVPRKFQTASIDSARTGR
jgi:hypothetical protein